MLKKKLFENKTLTKEGRKIVNGQPNPIFYVELCF